VVSFFHSSPDDRGLPDPLRIVRWGDRTYLIEDGKGLEFCNDVNSGLEPRRDMHGMSYLRRKDVNSSADGLPSVPDNWRRCLLGQPLSGHVVRVETNSTLVVDLGAKDGLVVGMELSACHPDGTGLFFLRVESVDTAQCLARDMVPDLSARPVAGDVVSTRMALLPPFARREGR